MELTDQRLTEAAFLSVRTQTNAKAEAIWHAALDDIWEAGGGGGGGGGERERGREGRWGGQRSAGRRRLCGGLCVNQHFTPAR